MISRVGGFLVLFVRFVFPWINRTASQRLGSYLTAIAIVLLGIGYALPALQGDDPGEPPAIEVPAIVVPAEDVPCVDCVPFLPGPDVPEPADAGPFAALTRGAGFAASLVPVGCSGAQRAAWQDAATKLGQCLAGLGVQQADDLVTAWVGGEAVNAADIGWDLLPGFLECAGRFGAVLYSGLAVATFRDSVGATMAPTARILTAIADAEDPLEAACGPRAWEPQCFVVLR